MNTTTKVLIGGGVVLAVFGVWYFATHPATPGAIVQVKKPVLTPAPTQAQVVANDIAAGTVAANAVLNLASNISSSGDDDDEDDSVSGVPSYGG
jgi:hypothetical protein